MTNEKDERKCGGHFLGEMSERRRKKIITRQRSQKERERERENKRKEEKKFRERVTEFNYIWSSVLTIWTFQPALEKEC